MPVEDGGKPPFEVEFGLGAAFGGMQKEGIQNGRRWFADKQEFMDYYARKGLELTGKL